MRKFPWTAILLFVVSGSFPVISCKKALSCENCNGGTPPVGPTINRAPVSQAGPDKVLVLPVDSVSLDGSASYDPDGTINALGSSRVDLQACKLEYSIVSPK